MNHAEIAQALLQLTGSLKPSGYTTSSDLEDARKALAQTLLHGIAPDQLISRPLPGTAKSPAIYSTVLDDTTQLKTQTLATAVAQAHTLDAAPTQLAYLSSFGQSSAPAWACGHADRKDA
jgi:hypothetical protein